MRLVFFYTADGPAPTESQISWDRKMTSQNFYASRIKEEGYYYLLSKLVITGIVDEVLIVIESNRSPGRELYERSISGLVVPTIGDLESELREDDIIWCRGGFRTWHDFLVRQSESKRWLLLYGANTGRERWRFWDVIFDDLNGRDFVDGAGRIHLDFRKPIRPALFKFKPNKFKYDLCIGASRIHDKKGQWRGIEIAIAYKKLFYHNLKCILPGPWANGVNTNQIKQKINDHRLSVLITNNVSRAELASIFNSSRVFAHLGSHGQGDRGPMEAMRCGCPLIIGFPRYHAPWVCADETITYIPKDPDDYDDIARQVRFLLYNGNNIVRSTVTEYFKANAGMDNIILPRMKRLFEFFRSNLTANKEALKKEYAL